jgi:glycosyltransferase involved in cell wall biosynthesis
MARFVVVTPVLNGAQYIRDTLASVRSQTEGDWVHYIIDGGSVDGTLDILSAAAAEDSRVKVITGQDRSLFDAGFKGIEAAKADGVTNPRTIFSWIGSDDLLMPWAFSTLRQHFDETDAEWVAALPAVWDSEGRLTVVQPFNWYPRWLIRSGQFHNRCLGTIQMESIFFIQGLIDKVPAHIIEEIRVKRLAADFLLWREFARHTRLVPISTAVSGFRLHEANLSSIHQEGYFREIRDSGVRFPPVWVGRTLRAGFFQLALVASGFAFRNAWRDFGSRQVRSQSSRTSRG